MKRSIAIILVLILAMTLFVACSNNVTNVEGLYKVKSINGKSARDYFNGFAEEYGMTIEVIAPIIGLDADKLDEFVTIELCEDHTAIYVAMGEAEEGTWEMKDGKLYVTIEGFEQELEYKNGEIYITMDDMTVVMAR